MVDVFAFEVGAALGELQEKRCCLLFWDVAVQCEMLFQVAAWVYLYPPEQNSRKK